MAWKKAVATESWSVDFRVKNILVSKCGRGIIFKKWKSVLRFLKFLREVSSLIDSENFSNDGVFPFNSLMDFSMSWTWEASYWKPKMATTFWDLSVQLPLRMVGWWKIFNRPSDVSNASNVTPGFFEISWAESMNLIEGLKKSWIAFREFLNTP